MQMPWGVPLSVPATGAAVTVTERVAVASLQPAEATVYVMLVVPTPMPVTTPFTTVATAGF